MPDMTHPSNITPQPSSNVEAPASPKLSMVALRERKKDQTREALARAAFALFQDKGYEATTVAEIARAANVSRRTFFRYYSTKDALLFVDNRERLVRFKELLALRQPGEHAFGPVRRACIAISEEMMRDRESMLSRAQIIDASPVLGKQERQQDLLWEDAISAALIAGLRDATPAAKQRARLVAGAVWGALRAIMADWTRSNGQDDLAQLTREGLQLFESAMSIDFERQPN